VSAAASCADVLVVDGVRYIGGRGAEAATPRLVGAVIHASTAQCPDGNPAVVTVDVRAIEGVARTDAVATTTHTRVLLNERLWSEPWSSLPPAVQAYVRADQ